MGATPLSIVCKPIQLSLMESVMNFELIADQAAECLLADLNDGECVDVMPPIHTIHAIDVANYGLQIELISSCSYLNNYYQSTVHLYNDLAA